MAKSRKRRRADRDDILIPEVRIEESLPDKDEETLTDAESRAQETVDLLMRDLFGTEQTSRSRKKSAPAQQPAQPTEQAAPAASEEPEPVAEQMTVSLEGEPPAESEDTTEELPIIETGDEPENAEPYPTAAEPTSTADLGDLSFKEQMEASKEDFNLLLDLGYEDELGTAIGFEPIRDYHEGNISKQHDETKRRRAAENIIEYNKPGDAEAFVAEYAKERREWKIRLGLSLFFLVLLILYERTALMNAIGGPFNGVLHPQSYILIGVQFLLFDAVLCFKQLQEGFTRLLAFSPVDNSLFSVLLLATFAYHITLLFLPHTAAPTLYLSPAALSLSLLCGVELLNTYRKSMTFDVVSQHNRKFALAPRISVGAKGHSARERLNAGDSEESMRYARPVYFVRNYNANTERRADYRRHLGAEILLIFAVGVAMGLYAAASGRPAEDVVGTILSGVILCAPAAALLFTAVPLYIAAALRLREKGAIVGEGAVTDADKPITLVLPDNEIFESMSHERLRLDEHSDVHRVSVVIRALLERVNSPLATAFGVDASSRLKPDAVTLTEVDHDGVSAVMADDGVSVRMGTPAYLARYGVKVDARDEDCRVLGVALDDRLVARFSVRYTLQEDVLPLLHDLRQVGARVAIRSKDPCVRNEIMADILPDLRFPVTVSKPSVGELELRTRGVDSTIVAIGSCKEVARTYVACRRVRRVGVWGRLMQIGSIALGVLFAVLFTMTGYLPTGITLTLWRMIWGVLYAGLSYLCLRLPQSERKQKEKAPAQMQMQMQIPDGRERERPS